MEIKTRKHYTLNEKEIEYINNIKEKYLLSSESLAIEKIIKEHEQFNDETQKKVIENIGKAIANNLKDYFKTIEKRTSYSDFNLQVIIEILNAMCLKNNIGKIRNSNEFKSEALEISEKYVKEKIISDRIKKLDNL